MGLITVCPPTIAPYPFHSRILLIWPTPLWAEWGGDRRGTFKGIKCIIPSSSTPSIICTSFSSSGESSPSAVVVHFLIELPLWTLKLVVVIIISVVISIVRHNYFKHSSKRKGEASATLRCGFGRLVVRTRNPPKMLYLSPLPLIPPGFQHLFI